MATRLMKPITTAVIDALKPGDIVHDERLPGFGARRQKEAVSYFVKLRVHGKQKWITLGRHGTPTPQGQLWAPDTARKAAIQVIANPLSADKPTAQEAATMRFDAVADQYLATHGKKKKPRTLEEYTRLVRLYLKPTFGHLPVKTIDRPLVYAAHAKWGAKHRRAANHALSVLSGILNWAELQGLRDEGTNPCSRIERYEEKSRERYLTTEELAALGETLDRMLIKERSNIYPIAAIRLLCFLGARLTEVLTLRWSYLDLDRKIIWLPDSKSGKKPIHLNDPAIAILENIPKVAGNPYVIVGHVEGQHFVNLKKFWRNVRKAAKIPDCRLHDLRHTFASYAISTGGTLPILGKQLGHSQAQTTDRYIHLAAHPVQNLSNVTATAIANAMTKKPDQAA